MSKYAFGKTVNLSFEQARETRRVELPENGEALEKRRARCFLVEGGGRHLGGRKVPVAQFSSRALALERAGRGP